MDLYGDFMVILWDFHRILWTCMGNLEEFYGLLWGF